jgi:hypothetical protein
MGCPVSHVDAAAGQRPGTNRVTVRVTDDGLQPQRRQSFNIIVAPPIIESSLASEGSITIRWAAIREGRIESNTLV